MAYAQDREDFEYLEGIAEVTDMVEIDASVWNLMRNPTKNEAAQMYRASIRLWFGEHGDHHCDDERVADIAERHSIFF